MPQTDENYRALFAHVVGSIEASGTLRLPDGTTPDDYRDIWRPLLLQADVYFERGGDFQRGAMGQLTRERLDREMGYTESE